MGSNLDIRHSAIIGIDVSTNRKKLGLAHLTMVDGHADQLTVTTGREINAVDCLAQWVSSAEHVLLAVDAPLGWPAPLGRSLLDHRAGEPLEPAPNDLFRRETDRFVKRTLGKQSLDVGADRIARTAHEALRILSALRDATGRRLPLAWAPNEEGAIEVYPAATLRAHGIPTTGYKKPNTDGRAARQAICEQISARVGGTVPARCFDSDDELDAVVCVLAGLDFASGVALPWAHLNYGVGPRPDAEGLVAALERALGIEDSDADEIN